MADRQDCIKRIVEMMQNHEDAIPFFVGYLTYGIADDTLQKAFDAYMAHDQDLGTLRLAQHLAQDVDRYDPRD